MSSGAPSSSSSAPVSSSGAGAASGGASGEEQTHVKLVSGEGHEFFVERDVAKISKTIAAMLSGSFAESSGEINLPEISSQILEKVIQYLHYKKEHTNSTQPIPEFIIEPEIVADLLMAANFLDC